MVEQQQDNQLQFLLSDLGTRIRDIEERTNSMKERLLLLGQNLISSREENEQRVSQIEKQNVQISQEIKKINSLLQNISSEVNNFVRKDEIILVERMLKDFQPLEFIRRKDVEEIIAEMMGNQPVKKETKEDSLENLIPKNQQKRRQVYSRERDESIQKE